MQCSIVLRILVVHRQISRPKEMHKNQCYFKIMEKWKWSSCQQKKSLLGMFVPAVILLLHWNWCPRLKVKSFLRGSPDMSKSTLLTAILNFELQEWTFFMEGKISRSSWREQRRRDGSVEKYVSIISRVRFWSIIFALFKNIAHRAPWMLKIWNLIRVARNFEFAAVFVNCWTFNVFMNAHLSFSCDSISNNLENSIFWSGPAKEVFKHCFQRHNKPKMDFFVKVGAFINTSSSAKCLNVMYSWSG